MYGMDKKGEKTSSMLVPLATLFTLIIWISYVRRSGRWQAGKELQKPPEMSIYSTGTQYSVMAYMRKESKKEWIYVYV